VQSRSFRLVFTPLLALLVAVVAACENPVGDGGGHRTAREVIITEADGTTVIAQTQNNAQWAGAPLTLRAGESREVRVFFVNQAGDRFQLPAAGASHTLHLAFSTPGVAGYEATSAERGHLRGLAVGNTTMSVHIWHGVHPGGHEDWSTPGLAVVVEP
jgi:hypothetical protein